MDTKILNGSVVTGRKEFFATEEKPFHFVDSGLDNVYLIGIKYFVDENGYITAEIPAMKQLMQLIAHDVTKSPYDLTGSELRFLRKRLGQKATEFCKYLDVDPSTLSRLENDKQPLTASVQNLARLSYAIFSQDPNLQELALKILKLMLNDSEDKRQKENIVLEIDQHQEWRELQAA